MANLKFCLPAAKQGCVFAWVGQVQYTTTTTCEEEISTHSEKNTYPFPSDFKSNLKINYTLDVPTYFVYCGFIWSLRCGVIMLSICGPNLN